MQDVNQSILAATMNTPKDFEKSQQEISAASAQNKYLEALENYKKLHTPRIKENKIGRNDPCPCGSEKKYKHCCLKTGEFENYIYKKVTV